MLGVSILGSVASIIYRQNLHTSDLRELGFDHETIDAVQQSFSAASEVANQLGMPELLDLGTKAFDQSVVTTCLIGGIFIFVIALIVWALIPKDVRITEDINEEGAEVASEANEVAAALAAEPTTVTEVEATEAPVAKPTTETAVTPATTEVVAAPCAVEPTATKTVEVESIEEGTTRVSISLNTDVMLEMKRVCKELGITPQVAFTIFATKVAKEKHIPFELTVRQEEAASNTSESSRSNTQ